MHAPHAADVKPRPNFDQGQCVILNNRGSRVEGPHPSPYHYIVRQPTPEAPGTGGSQGTGGALGTGGAPAVQAWLCGKGWA